VNHTVIFDKKEADCEIRLARFLGELIRQGIGYTLQADQWAYEVKLTGGF
jgi:hypothetical protein